MKWQASSSNDAARLGTCESKAHCRNGGRAVDVGARLVAKRRSPKIFYRLQKLRSCISRGNGSVMAGYDQIKSFCIMVGLPFKRRQKSDTEAKVSDGNLKGCYHFETS
jgi:hypothetical protein